MKKLLRGMGIGLFLAGALFTVRDFLDEPLSSQTDMSSEKQIAELQQQLADANKKIATLTEAAPSVEETKEEQSVETTGQASPSVQVETGESGTISGTIYIYEGVSLYDIGKQAEDAGIIANSRELELFLSKPEYARSIQKGQFELHSGMSIEEMANTLTGKKEN